MLKMIILVFWIKSHASDNGVLGDEEVYSKQ